MKFETKAIHVGEEPNLRKELFGYIENSRMFLNKYGEIDEYIVMPNHIHGIIRINNSVGDGHV